MKSFIFALLTFAVCVSVAVFGQVYVTKAIEYQLAISESFEISPDENKASEYIERLDIAINEWISKRRLLCAFISHRDFDEVENQLISLKSAVISGDAGNYVSSLELLKQKLWKLKLSEKLSFEGLF